MTFVYILKSIRRPAQLYVGVTSNLTQRLQRHNEGKFAYNAECSPWEIVYSEMIEEKAVALRRGRQIKGWPRARTEALIRDRY